LGLHNFNIWLIGLNKPKHLIIALICTIILGFVDYSIGPELSFSVFYIIPIMVSTWYAGKDIGVMIAIISAFVWFVADLTSGFQYSSNFIPIWNSLVRLSFFLIIMWLLYLVKQKLVLEETLADTDHLTNLANRRFFYEQLDREHARLSRYPGPITIAYLDLDNFKMVNDSMGHDTGDHLLQIVADSLCQNIRASDCAARLGGDEFAILFPQLETQSTIPLLKKLQSELLAEMENNNWPVTVSIGAITFDSMSQASVDMINKVDALMYDVKKSGKNNIRHTIEI